MKILLFLSLFFIASCASNEPTVTQPADDRINRSQENTDSLFNEFDYNTL